MSSSSCLAFCPRVGRRSRPGATCSARSRGSGSLTYTPAGIVLDRLTLTQRRILELLEVEIPWPEQER